MTTDELLNDKTKNDESCEDVCAEKINATADVCAEKINAAAGNEAEAFLKTFDLHSSLFLSVSMPAKPCIGNDDVDAQLFSFVANAPKGSNIHSIADLSDDWVKSNFEEIENMQQLRASIVQRLEEDIKYSFADLKYRKCADALILTLAVEVSDSEIAQQMPTVQKRIEESLRMAGVSKAVYLENEGISEDVFLERVREETRHVLALNKAMDEAASLSNVVVADEEIPSFLSCEDPKQFISDLVEKGSLEQARQAAARVKVMRAIIAAAVVTQE
ncbi:MAG: hypothetical protein LBG97_00070 [Coriobacteriales bacterium]|jgi:trigger factor|nr:hypothetical protein [Coriobacteriales bacterium]